MQSRGMLVLMLLFFACVERGDSIKSNDTVLMVNAPDSLTEGNVDLERSVIYWRGTKFMKTRYHEGFVKFKAGNLEIENGIIKEGSFIADMSSIEGTDIPEHETEARSNLETHLKSEFAVDQFPYSEFTITATGQSGSSQQICGDFRIKNITHGLCFEVTSHGNQYIAEVTLDRTRWNVGQEGSWLEKRLVDDEFYLRINLWIK